MTEKPESPKEKLTLSSSKLSLNKNIDPTKLGQGYVALARTNSVMVEVKKSKSLSFKGQAVHSGDGNSMSSDEVHHRLSIFKKATESINNKISEDRSNQERVGSLSTFGLPKRNTDDSEVGESIVEPDAPSTNQDAEHTKHHSHIKKANPTNFDDEDDAANKKKLAENKLATVRHKMDEPKKLNKTAIIHMLEDDGASAGKMRSLASIKRSREKEKRKLQQQTPQEKVYREVVIPETMSVGELASRMSERGADVIKELMKLGIIANLNQDIDADTAELVVTTLGHTPRRVQESDVENILQNETDRQDQLRNRAPVVTVMGHVDHGKTSLLDALKSTDVVSGEAGGITQHIGAYRITLAGGEAITFIDTPGHAAFTEIRTRGAKVTDIVVLVVAADDGIKTQTIEAINHAKAANVPIIVAINKIDKPGADIERVKQELLQHELVSEEFGGETIVVPVSAKMRTNLDKLEESILLVAEMLGLKANPDASASGVVIESKVDKGKGIIATVLIQRGTLRVGDLVVAGSAFGRIKKMMNDKGYDVKTALPSEPVEIVGLDTSPMAGDALHAIENEKQARDITEYRARKMKENKVSITKRSSLEELFLKAAGSSALKELPVIIKGDVQGSIEAIISSITNLSNDEVRLKVLHSAVGAINESDVTLAEATGAMIVGFNVRALSAAAMSASKANVDMRYYSIIYNLIDDIKAIMSGMLSPIIREQYIGSVEVRQIFNITKVGKIAGSYVTKGVIKRGAGVRLLRDNIVIHEGKLKTLKRFKDDVAEVKDNYECGIAFENYEDIRVGDMLEVFETIEEKQTL
jgi:translation initiation factor IF-2